MVVTRKKPTAGGAVVFGTLSAGQAKALGNILDFYINHREQANLDTHGKRMIAVTMEHAKDLQLRLTLISERMHKRNTYKFN